ncbi:MAG TPA: DUF1801 domain-containing protein [Anaerolineales bacterium]|nr:DUF1801 domain-containing protein [Anaerolineales bacterium]
MKPINEQVEKYFSSFDGVALERLHTIRNLIFELIPEASEAIKYGIPTILYHGNLVHYAAFKNHIGLYPTPSGMDAFSEEMAAYKQGKGSVQFPFKEPLPIDLIKKIVMFRIQETGV